MKKEWLLAMACGLATLGLALLLLRWLAPGLLGVPVDLQLVQVKKKVPPFYDNIFRLEELKSRKAVLQDPVTKTRRLPLMEAEGNRGPHDILGFRNKAVPNVSDIVVIGDSQSYGFNVPMELNWPSQLHNELQQKQVSLFNMSVGGWGAVQYSYISQFAYLFQPRAVIVAFYTGNDPLESFTLAYGSEGWKELRPDSALTKSDVPEIRFPVPPEEKWPVTFSDGIKTVFTPDVRLSSNLDHPAVRAGYEIMARTAESIAREAARSHFRIFFTIIPTKELVYAAKIRREQITTPSKYQQLIANETNYINILATRIKAIDNAQYIDLVAPLQEQALFPTQLYPEFTNGHPLYNGYDLIGRVIAGYVKGAVPMPPSGFFHTNLFKSAKPLLCYADDTKYWILPSEQFARTRGWQEGVTYPFVTPRDIAGLQFKGLLK